MTLADVLAPITVDRFVRDYLGEQYLQISGWAGRFKDVLSWHDLDTTLSRLRVDDNRVALVKDGHFLPQSSYTYTSLNGRIPYLIGPMINTELLNGASLIVNHVDTLFPGVRELVESCEDTFEIHVGCNLYAGWRTHQGFDVHWDKHDTLIVQVIGRKNWKLWRPTRLHPLSDDVDGTERPKDTPVWEGVLEDGAILYMPRGWWHVAWPCDEPSLHITLGIKHPTGTDLLAWACHKAKATKEIRQDVPHWKEREYQRLWLAALRTALMDVLRDHIVDDYLDHLIQTTHPRSLVRLPTVGMSRLSHDIEAHGLLRLIHVRRLTFTHDRVEGMIALEGPQSRQLRCSALLQPALELLHARRPCTLTDMLNVVPPRSKPLVRPIVSALINAGIVWLEQAPVEHVRPTDTSRIDR